MTFLKTLLVSTAICAGLLAALIHSAGDLPPSKPHAGLTAADILGSDGTTPAAKTVASPDFDRGGLAQLAAGAVGPAAQPAADDGSHS